MRLLPQVIRCPDLVLYDHVDIAQCQMVLPAALRSDYMVWVHGIEVWKSLPPRKLAALQGAKRLIFNSEYTRARFEEFHAFSYDSAVVPLMAEFTTQQEECSRNRMPWILTVGRLEPDRPKGHAEILRVLPQVVSVVPDVVWHVVGAGKHLDSFRREVDESGCADFVKIHGFVETDELNDLYRTCRVFAMPSHGEGFGIVYVEAMAHGCIPVGSTKDAAPEVIRDAGACVSLDEPDELSHELISLLTMDDSEYSERSHRAIQRAQTFSSEAFGKRFLEAIEV